MRKNMQRVNLNRGEIEYTVHGQGESVLMIHGAHVADSFMPFVGQDALSKHALIRYHRRGYGGSARTEDPPDAYISHGSADAAELLTRLGIENAHVVGHSSGAIIAIQLACDHPDLVKSLVLIEPPLLSVPSAASHGEKLGGAASRYFKGDAAAAVDDFMQIVSGPRWRELTEAGAPGGSEQAIRDAATFFEFELPGAVAWQCDVEKAKSYSGPVLFVRGEKTPKFHAEAGPVISEWFPQAEDRVIVNATHMVMLDNPEDAAKCIAEFFDQLN
jgi:pimeloyl-ACP methyl ester carboxylesterase